MKSMKFLKFLSISNRCSLNFRIPSSSISLQVCRRERCRNRKIFRYPNTLGHTHTQHISIAPQIVCQAFGKKSQPLTRGVSRFWEVVFVGSHATFQSLLGEG